MNDFNKHVKSDTIKWIVVFTLLIVLMAGMVASILLALPEDEPVEEEQQESAPDLAMEFNNTEHVKLALAQFDTPSGTPTNTTPSGTLQKTLTATITPATASNKLVDWDIEWADGYTLETVTAYVTVTPTSDGALTANVACLGDFGEQIIIKVTSRQNPDASATCTVDYAPRVVDIKFTADDLTFYAEEDSVTLSYTDSRSLGWSAVWSDGTLTPSTTAVSFSYQLNDTLLSRLNSSGISFSNDKLDTSSAFPSGTDMYLWGGSALFSDLVTGRVETDYSLLQVPLNQVNQAIELARSLITEVMYTINYSITSETATYAGSIAVYFTSASLTVSVDGISMGTSNLIF